MSSQTGKTVLITGCSDGGIGHFLAREFQRRGFHVFASARNVSKMQSLASLANVSLLGLDVTSKASIADALSTVSNATGGKLDYLVNNAGSVLTFALIDMDDDMEAASRAMFEVNIWGVINMIRAFSPMLIASKGTIVSISSVSSFFPVPYMTVYNASKAALNSLSETLRLELAPFGVRVLTIVTGAVESHVHANTSVKESEALPPNSLYTPAMNEIHRRVTGVEVAAKEPTDKYARKAVDDILGGASGMVYRGKTSSSVRIFTSWMPTFVVDSLLWHMSGLSEIRRA